MLGGSLNISLSNNPVFLAEHFTRVVLLEAIGLCGFSCYPRVISRVDTTAFATSYLAHVYCKIIRSISSVGTNFETFREQVVYLHFVLLRRARKFD